MYDVIRFIRVIFLTCIEGTEYITDGIWLIYRNNVIGKIDYDNLKVYIPT